MAISRDGSDAYLLSLQLAGRAELSQGGRDTVLKPGDLGIVDARRPFSVKLSGDVWRAAAILPRRMVHRYAPVWRDLPALRIGNSEPAVDLVREYLLRLADPAFAVHSVVAEVLGENLSTLLGVVVGHSVDGLAGDRLQRDLRLEALLAYMRRNCSDPDLSPSAAAAHLRISVRTVHKLMKQTERSFGEWLLDERLHRCVHMLQDPAQLRRKISDIAWTCGFNDLSHFNNLFRSRFARTPSDLRRAATTADRSDLHADFRPGFPNARDEDNSHFKFDLFNTASTLIAGNDPAAGTGKTGPPSARARRMTVLAWLK